MMNGGNSRRGVDLYNDGTGLVLFNQRAPSAAAGHGDRKFGSVI